MTSPTVDPPTQPTTRPRRSWWRVALSLRVLMVLVLVLGGVLGWQARRASIQRRAVAQLKEAGATLAYDWQATTLGRTPTAGPPAPEWVRRVVGDEPFQDVYHVDLDRRTLKAGEPTETTMAALAALDHLDTLNLIYPPVTDAELVRLRGLPRLRSAIFLDTKLTDAALETVRTWPRLELLAIRFSQPEPARAALSRLAGMTQLRRLNLSRLGPIEPVDLAMLATMPDLEYLALQPSPTGGSCLASLARLTHLTGIHLSTTQPTDADLQSLAHLANLERVALDGARLSDAGLTMISRWRQLQELFLVVPQANDDPPTPPGNFTDAGLAALADHPTLDNLTLAGHFTDKGLAALNRVPKLTTLSLYGLDAGATAAGLRALLIGRQFRQLSLRGSGVRDDWAGVLAGQTSLEFLTLAGPNVTDATLGPLVGMAALGRLFLVDAPITDAGLATLARRGPGLRNLYLRRTAVTPAGVAAFQAAQPGCRIDYQPAPVANPVVDPRR